MTERTKRSGWSFSATILVAILATTLFGGFYGERLFGSTVHDDLQQRLKEYTEVLDAASEWAVDEPTTEDLIYSSIDGMLRTLDPHSSFLEPRRYAEMQDRQKGTFYGLGILVTKRNDRVTVITPLEGTPASRQGIRAGDIIAEVEGEPTDDMSIDEVVRRLKGPKGTTVNIRIMRVGMDELLPFSIVRAAIPTNSISNVLMVRPGVGYIRIKDFTYTTVRELDEALAKLRAEGMQKLILDLRANPGGLLDAAVGVSDYFVDKGDMVVYTKGRTPDSEQEYLAPGTHPKVGVPLIVMIDRGSASASEIVAGAVQDHDRGLVVGETSWGKGLVQSVYSLPYGAGLALTTSKYFTPSGRNIQRDYSSFFDYYVAEENPDYVPEDAGNVEIYHTDIGRKVYGGGGIAPDVVVKPRELSRVLQILMARSAIFNFAIEYVAKHPEVDRTFQVGPEIVAAFSDYAVTKEIAARDEIDEILETEADRQYLGSLILAEVIAAKFGYDASYPYRLQADDQVAKALELFPEAEKLARQAARARSARTADAAPASGGAAASKVD